MRYMLIGFNMLGICMNINFATNEAIPLIASKGVVPYGLIRESQTHHTHTSVNDASERKVNPTNSLTFETFSCVVSSAGSLNRSSPIPIVPTTVLGADEKEGSESRRECSISPLPSRRRLLPQLCLDLFSTSPIEDEDDEKAEELLNREDAKLVLSTSEEDFFNRDMSWDTFNFQQSQSSEDLIPIVVAPRLRATVTFTRTNVVTEVQFGSIPRCAFDRRTHLASASATPINDVPRPLRPSARTHEGRLKEAQINNILPVKFGINPKTNEERVVFMHRRQDCQTPRPLQSTHFCVNAQTQESSVFEPCVSEVPAQTKVDEPQEVET